LRGVTFQLAAPAVLANANRGATVFVTVQTGTRTLSSARFLNEDVPAGPMSIAVPGEDVDEGVPLQVTVRETGIAGGLRLASEAGSPACSLVSPRSDGLRLVAANAGAIVYQRLDAMPRIRWASRAVVVPDADARIVALTRGVPPDEVVLDAPAGSPSGRGATITHIDDTDDDRITARVTSQGSGYLVVADAMQQPGWSVTVDGQPANLIPADEAMAAVAVPEGVHTVEFRYRAPGQLTGAVVTVLAVLALVAIVVWDRFRRRHHPRHARQRGRSEPMPASPPSEPQTRPPGPVASPTI
jgi:hypothetical protein